MNSDYSNKSSLGSLVTGFLSCFHRRAGKCVKLNCWEYKKCGREPNGVNSAKLGVCPAATEMRTDGMNSGKNGGRVCWAIAGTLCGGEVQGTFACKCMKCLSCSFYKLVFREEMPDFVNTELILKKLR
jgi:hypothetical protein